MMYTLSLHYYLLSWYKWGNIKLKTETPLQWKNKNWVQINTNQDWNLSNTYTVLVRKGTVLNIKTHLTHSNQYVYMKLTLKQTKKTHTVKKEKQ